MSNDKAETTDKITFTLTTAEGEVKEIKPEKEKK